MIKALTFTFIFISGVLLLSNCEQENANPRSYPRVNTLQVTNISEKGASFRAELYSLGTEKIIDHGFVWGTSDQTITYSDRVNIGPCDSTGTFQANVTTSLRKDLKYIVKPFIQTADHIIYGAPVTFKSLGSGAPAILSFEPHSAAWLDTLYIKGKHFSFIAGENEVKLNETICTILSSTDSTLQVIVSEDHPDLKSVISVGLAGNVAVHVKDTFKLIPPVIQDFYPNQAHWGDTIFIKGKYLKYLPYRIKNYIKLGNFTCSYIKSINDSVFAIRVPNELNSISSSMSGLLTGIPLSCSKNFTLISPVITSIYPKKGLGHSIITLYGKFNPLQSRNIIELNNVAVAITYNSKDSIKIAIPYSTPSGTITQFTYKSEPFVNTFDDLFTIVHPIITSISPLTAYFGDEVTILGENLKSQEVNSIVYLGSISAPVKSTSENSIVFTVPPLLDSIPRKIQIRIAPENVVSTQSFVLAPPEINSVSPATFSEGDEITINGKGFCPDISLNKILIGSSPATILSATTNVIRAKAPLGLTRGFLNMYLFTGLYKRSFPLGFEFKSKWSSIYFPGIPPYGYESYYRPVSFSVDGKGYFLDNPSKRLYSFDPISKNFTDLGIQTALQSKAVSQWVVNNNTFYFVGSTGIFRFKSSDRSWTEIASNGSGKQDGTVFSLNGKLYYGLTKTVVNGYYSVDKNISVYDSVNNSWSVKTTFPFSSSFTVDRSFVLNNKAYFLFNDGLLYEYSPETNAWSQKNKFPAPYRTGGVNFNLGAGECFGLGRQGYEGSPGYDDFYFYDPVANSWTKAQYQKDDGSYRDIVVPGGGRFNTVNFMIGNKEYIGFGINGNSRLNDFYEFDPNYPL